MPFTERLDEAFAYAHLLHRDQVRKSTDVPYVSHVMAVAALVAEYGGTEDQVIAALLHDGPEDQGGRETLAEIERRFGPAVSEIVAACSDTFERPKPPWRERKQAYVDHLATAPEAALLVSASDKLHNSRSIVADLRVKGRATFDIFKGGLDGTLWYYRSLVEKFRDRMPGSLTEELARTVADMERLASDE